MIVTAIRLLASATALAVGIASAAAQSAEPARPHLKGHVTVNSGIVRIGLAGQALRHRGE